MDLRKVFAELDRDGDGVISPAEMQSVLMRSMSSADAAVMTAEVDRNQDGRIEFHEFQAAMQDLKISKAVQKTFVRHGAANSQHSWSSEEMQAFTEVVNSRLGEDQRLQKGGYLPIDNAEGSTALFEKCADGVVLCRLISLVDPDAVDLRAINFPPKLSKFKIIENNNLAINAAKDIGCRITNIGAHDVMEGRPHLILGLLWQIIRLLLTMKISIREYPEMARLLRGDETLAQLLALPPERVLVRWINYHLENAKSDRRVGNLGKDLSDSVVYDTVMRQLYKGQKLRGRIDVTEPNLEKRASTVLDNAEGVGVSPFIKARDVASGNAKLNLAFCAQLFNDCHGLAPLDQEEAKELADLDLDDAGDTREARTFKLWMNSLNLTDPSSNSNSGEEASTLQINDLFRELCNGLPILSVMDHIEAGSVPWKKVRTDPKNRHHVVENGNHVVTTGKKLDLVMVNIGGLDIADGNKKLILAVMWQLMRRSTVDLLSSLKNDGSKVEEKELIKFANDAVKTLPPGVKKSSGTIRTLGDRSLSTSLFLIDLCEAVSPETVNWDLVTPGKTDEDALLNARYCLSIARKLGAGVFCTPEDLKEVRPKMILLFIAAIWKVNVERESHSGGGHAFAAVPPALENDDAPPPKRAPPPRPAASTKPSWVKPQPAEKPKGPPSWVKPQPAEKPKGPPSWVKKPQQEEKTPPPSWVKPHPPSASTAAEAPPSRPPPAAPPAPPSRPAPVPANGSGPTRPPPPVPRTAPARKPLPPPPGGQPKSNFAAAPPPPKPAPAAPQGGGDHVVNLEPDTKGPYSFKSVNGTGETGALDSNDVGEEEWD